MSRKYLQATLVSGAVVIAAFEKLGGTGQGYSTQVFAGRKPFNGWRVVGDTHPVSGEPVVLRTRTMYAGHQIASITAVKPKDGRENDHGYESGNFEPVAEIQSTEHGMYTAPTANTPEGAVAGVDYPVHRDPNDLRRYVILRAANDIGPETRFYVDAASAAPDWSDDDDVVEARHVRQPGDADEDVEL